MKKELTNKQVNSNILKYYICRALYGVTLANAIFTVFMLSKGLSYSQIGVAESIFGFAALVEIFGGAFADLMGRKIAVFLQALIVACSSIIFGFSQGFFGFAFANALWGIGLGVGAGADNALVYDSLKAVGRTHEFIRVHGRGRTFALISGMLGTLLGTYLYSLNPTLPFFVSAVLFVASGVIVLFMREPRVHQQYSIRNHYTTMRAGFRYIFLHKNVRWIVLFGMLAILFNGFFSMIQSPYILSSGFTIKDLGWILAVTIAIEALFAYSAETIHQLFSERTCFTIVFLCYAASAAGFAYAFGTQIIAIFLLLKFSGGFGFTFAEHYLQKHSTSKIRASIGAAEGFILDLVMVFSLPLLGLLVDAYSLRFALFVIAGVLFVGGTVLMLVFPTHKHRHAW